VISKLNRLVDTNNLGRASFQTNIECSSFAIVSQSSGSAMVVAETGISEAPVEVVNPAIALGNDRPDVASSAAADTTQVDKCEDLKDLQIAEENLDLNELKEEILEGADEEDAGFDVVESMTKDVYRKNACNVRQRSSS
jgi:hypothetical protein